MATTRVDIVLPAIGEAVPVLRITEWFKAVGEPVAEGEPLLSVSTDKMDFDLPAPAAGRVAEIRAAAGEVCPVLSVVGVIESD